MKSTIFRIAAASCALALSLFASSDLAQAQQPQIKRIAAKSGETVDLFTVFAQANCRSTLLETPQVEVLQGPPELTLSVREQIVAVPQFECHNKLKGGMVVATVGQVKQPIEGKLIFRVKFKTKVGESQNGHTFFYSLFP
ncbi:MAG: hypothetical protein ACLPJW_10685 [Rhodomicrobium sp.]